jgi:hypothetical protein
MSEYLEYPPICGLATCTSSTYHSSFLVPGLQSGSLEPAFEPVHDIRRQSRSTGSWVVSSRFSDQASEPARPVEEPDGKVQERNVDDNADDISRISHITESRVGSRGPIKWKILCGISALVRFILEEEGAFSCHYYFLHTSHGKTYYSTSWDMYSVLKKSTRVPVSPVPSAPLQIKFYQFCYIN